MHWGLILIRSWDSMLLGNHSLQGYIILMVGSLETYDNYYFVTIYG